VKKIKVAGVAIVEADPAEVNKAIGTISKAVGLVALQNADGYPMELVLLGIARGLAVHAVVATDMEDVEILEAVCDALLHARQLQARTTT
jgi:hypothetical protein